MSASAENNQVSQNGRIVLCHKASQEKTAITNIVRQGYDAYCPMIERTRRHARKVEKVFRPLFPPYIFVRLDEQRSQWRPLLSTIGVRSVVRFREKLGFLPKGFVEEMRAYEKADGLGQMMAARVEPGMQVKILDGPFKDFIATVLSMSEKDRVWLLLDIMGRETRIQHDVWSLTS